MRPWSLWQTSGCVLLHSMWSRQLKCFAPGLRASFFIPQESSTSIWPRRSTRETSDAMTPAVIMTSRRRSCLRAAFEVALCGERRQKKDDSARSQSGRCVREMQNRSPAMHRQLLPTSITARGSQFACVRPFLALLKSLISPRWPISNSCRVISAQSFGGLRTPSG